jgi:hypothetical protein
MGEMTTTAMDERTVPPLFLYGPLVAAMVTVAATAAVAEPERAPLLLRESADEQSQPAALSWGAVRLLPALSVATGYDDNIFESDGAEVDSLVYEVRPELLAEIRGDRQAWQLGYQGRRIEFEESGDDSETDHRGYLRGAAQFGLRHSVNGALQWYRGHERRGTGLSEGINPAVDDSLVPSPDRFTDRRADLGYTFGADAAAGRLRFKLGHFEREYDNNRFRTSYFDREENRAAATFLWRIMPRTSLLFEGRIADIDYARVQPGQPALDSREESFFTGAEWRLTDRTQASVLVGHTSKDFDDAAREDGDNVAWEVGGSWSPRSYSTFEVSLRRSPEETNGTGDFIDTRAFTVGWEHQWLPRLGTRVAYQNVDQSYQSAARDKQIDSVMFRVTYQMRRWLRWNLDMDWRERDSDVQSLEFERNQYWIGAEITL